MSIEESVQTAVVAEGIRAEVFKQVFASLERSLARAKDNGDTHAAEVIDVELAKLRGLERNWPT